ncbi:hypothetical protein NAEGRDRAFT_80179 [Naegleria gruberi]|uniref:F-box domain-containing protein n=1 Tax=Naegleria gruberi TaxID=5762 RepID=D2VJD7_NAEGR|nr:uncharacterized protein NAEGRDRAFT_80179 [Naegleria gruberi]EFC43021.1 hypothetical protein NAEGRDRAFT_80179 [Naegleria gruberi]|eukprot:XP_002675765.1 hypothetical protein NAEGRDRAFT_80179 [Naegleria gruberi strain NEG-M]
MNIFDDLPNDCWIHIFGYLSISEVKKYSLSISQNLALRLLETEDDHNSIYRYLCEVKMRSDLDNALESIENRKEMSERYYYRHNNRRTGLPAIARNNNSPAGLSSKQMRENLKHCTIRAKYLFSRWFKEDPSLYERIKKAITRSFSSNTVFIPDLGNHDTTLDDIERLKLISEKENAQLEKTTNDFILDMEKQVEKQRKKHPKWKQIWNGYHVQSSYSSLKSSTKHMAVRVSKIPSNNRRYRGTPLTNQEFEQYLTDIYEGFKSLEPELRREAMFKNFKFQFKYYSNGKYHTSKSSVFSQITTGVYKLSKKIPDMKNIEKIYGKLLEFFIEESIAYKVETPILTDCM